jgi:hypothetical protein
MAKGVWVWVVQFNDPDCDVTIQLYAEEKKAYEVALNEALEHMSAVGCNSHSILMPGWSDAYNKVFANKDANPTVAMDAYNTWNDNSVTDELSRYYIFVNIQEIEGDLNISSSAPVQPVKLADVPCRVCGKNVNASESTCWCCGCDHPTRR